MLKFQPKPGSVIYCDYVGFIKPEMVKRRPAIVISKHRQNSKLLSIVPISKTVPIVVFEYQIEMDSQFCLIHLAGERSWVKCDMFNVVSLSRLHLLRDKNSGLRHAPNVGDVFLEKVKKAIKDVHRL